MYQTGGWLSIRTIPQPLSSYRIVRHHVIALPDIDLLSDGVSVSGPEVAIINAVVSTLSSTGQQLITAKSQEIARLQDVCSPARNPHSQKLQ
jgi:hypothetical protein